MRRAQADVVAWFPRIFLMLVALVIIVMLVRTYTDRQSSSPETSRAVLIYRLVYSDLLMAEDATGRVTVGVVDMSKATQATIDAVFNYDGRLAAKITFTSHACPFTGTALFVDEDTYAVHAPFGNTLRKGTTREEKLFPVTLRKDDMACAGVMNVSVVQVTQ
jgi:hypothetical protein